MLNYNKYHIFKNKIQTDSVKFLFITLLDSDSSLLTSLITQQEKPVTFQVVRITASWKS